MINVVNSQHERCECHECTQARWKMHAGGGLAQLEQYRQYQPPNPPIGVGTQMAVFAKPFPNPQQ
jgi:hypothetical protein